MFLALATVLGLVIRIALRRWFGRDPTIAEPTYARRLAAGISEGVGSGVVPALIFGALLYRVTSEVALVGGVFADVLAATCITAIFLVISYALPRAGWWGFAALVEGENKIERDGAPRDVELGGVIWVRARELR